MPHIVGDRSSKKASNCKSASTVKTKIFVITRIKPRSRNISPRLCNYLLRVLLSFLKECPYVLAYGKDKLRLSDLDNNFYIEITLKSNEFVIRHVKDLPDDFKRLVTKVKSVLLELALAKNFVLLKISNRRSRDLEVCFENVSKELAYILMEKLKFNKKESSRTLCKLYSGPCGDSLAFQDIVHLCQLAKLRGYVVLYVNDRCVLKIDRIEDVWSIILGRGL